MKERMMIKGGNGAAASRIKGAGVFFRPGFAVLLVLALPGCSNYNLSLEDFFEDGRSAKAITAFGFASPAAAGVINETDKTIAVTVLYGTDRAALVPAIVHTGASVSPGPGEAQDFTAPVSYTVTAADGSAAAYTVTVTVAAALFSPGDVAARLNASAGGPVFLPVDMNLSAGSWAALLDAIAAASPPKNAALDLSACTITGMTGTPGEFDPAGSNSAGKDRIVSLVLPDTAVSVKAGTPTDPAFKHFTNLVTVRGDGITAAGDYAFSGCTALDTVYLTAVTDIGDYAFSGCTALDDLYLPAAPPIKGTGIFTDTYTFGFMIDIHVGSAGAVLDYAGAWGVLPIVTWGLADGVYGSGHNDITINS
ncbi:MAG: leucine-rich repeat protein [Treponema sp.]|jgi:hypothetical protein|nr:leucine-rich repeat protein [Treponema sp.]